MIIMQISKGKMVIHLEENIEKLKETIEELKHVKEVLVNSAEYKLLNGKTQTMDVEIDEPIRSRGEHSEGISRIASSIIEEIYALCASPEMQKTELFQLNKQVEILYTEIVSLGHDLGHTPFGHDGEKSINEFMQKIQNQDEIKKILKRRIECFGIEYEIEQGHIGEDVTLSFEHNEQSSLIFSKLAQINQFDTNKVEVERIIRAILAHSTTRVPNCPEDLVAQVVRHTDKIEYRNADFEEMEPYIILQKIENQQYAEIPQEERISEIILEVAKEAVQEGKVGDKMVALERLKKLRKEYEASIYFLVDGQRGLLTGKNIERNRLIILRLLDYYYAHPEKIPTKTYGAIHPISKTAQAVKTVVYTEQKEQTDLEKTIEYILSMDNKRAKDTYSKLVKKRIVTGEGIEPITEKEIEEMKERQIQEKVEKLRAAELVKTAQPHTDRELRNIVIATDRLFVQKYLTQAGKEQIRKNKEIIDAENELDRMLGREMKIADLSREYGVRIDILGRNDGEREKEEERISIVRDNAQRIKRNWVPIREIPVEQQMPYVPEDSER